MVSEEGQKMDRIHAAHVRAITMRQVTAILLADAIIAGEPLGELSIDYEAAVNEWKFADADLFRAIQRQRETLKGMRT